MYLNTTLDVTLEPVTIDNFEALMAMALPPEQADYLASNAYLIAQSHCYPDWRPRAILVAEIPVAPPVSASVARQKQGGARAAHVLV